MYGMCTVLQPLIPGFQETRFAEMQKKTPAPKVKVLGEVELTTLSGSKETAQADQAASVRLCWYKWIIGFWIFEAPPPPSNFAILAIFGTSAPFLSDIIKCIADMKADAAFVDSAFKEVLKRGNTPLICNLGLFWAESNLPQSGAGWRKVSLLENFGPDRVRARAMTKPYTSQTPTADFG